MPEEQDAQRRFARDVVERLTRAGRHALWAGGCVRDQLLGAAPKDYDVATSATPDEVREVFGRRRTIPVGAAFGVITVLGPRGAGQIEVATFRTDGGYSDGRHPDAVRFSDARHDAERRDFTINGLFFDPLQDEVIDYVGGRRDLDLRIIRAIGDPGARFGEDKLRMLRAARFATTLGFEIEAATLEAIRRQAADIRQVSQERIGAEVSRLLTHANRARGLQLLRQSGLLRHVLPEAESDGDARFEEACAVLSRLDAPELATCLAAVLPAGSARPAGSRLAKRLKFTNDDAKRADWILDHLELASGAIDAPWPTVQRMLIHPDAQALIALVEARAGGATESTRFCRQKLAAPRQQLNPPPLLSGDDLIAAGAAPGPQMGRLLERIRDEQLLGNLTSREEALRFALRREEG